MFKRLEKFKETGNTEHLVDIASLCMIEFTVGQHPLKHFWATDDEDHTELKVRVY